MKRILSFLLIALLIFSTPVFAEEVPHVQAPSYMLMSIDTGVILIEQNCTVSITPGEFSKLMTALVAVEKLKETDIITFEEKDLSFQNPYGNIASVRTGESFTFREHLSNMLLLYSDASANAIARQAFGSVEEFTKQMNKKAKELKAENALFVSPSGYDPESKSALSPKDLALIMAKAYENPLLKDVLSTVLFELRGERFSCRNHLLSKYTYSDFTYSPAKGMVVCERKDSCDIVSVASKGNSEFIAVVVGSPKSTAGRHYFDTINLFEYIFNNYTLRTVCREKTILDQIEVRAGSKSSVTLETAENCVAYTPYDYDKKLLTHQIIKEDHITAPVKQGEILATAVFYYKDTKLGEIPLVASEGVHFRLITPFLSHINTRTLLVAVILLIIFFTLKYNSAKKKERRRKRREKIRNEQD